MDMREQMRKMAEDSQRFMVVEDCTCFACGRSTDRVALNLIWYYATPTVTPIDGGILKPIAGGEKAVVQFPICNTCAPPCKKCQLPRKTKVVRQAGERVSKLLGRKVSGFPGCRHAHILGLVL